MPNGRSFLPCCRGRRARRTAGPGRTIARFSTAFFVLRMGMPWRDLPERYGPIRGSAIAAIAGARRAFGYEYSRLWHFGGQIAAISATDGTPSVPPAPTAAAISRDVACGSSPARIKLVLHADSDEGGQLFRLKADSASDRLRTPFR